MKIKQATTLAHPNIALAKYWGKRDYGHNLPAVPSLSVTLAGMTTATTVTFDPALEKDTLVLGGQEAPATATARVTGLLDRIRKRAGMTEKARVVSANDFPTAAGLASSASAFAALALAASSAAGLQLPNEEISNLARLTSVSAARSVFGGFVELRAGWPKDEKLSAQQIAPPEHWPIRIVVAVVTEGPKAVSSTDGMLHTVRTSPYYAAWVERAPGMFGRIKRAILDKDIEALGIAAEESALAMHASSIAATPGLLYWTGTTLEVLAEVRRLRAVGLGAYATIDAGPHVKVICSAEDEIEVAKQIASVPGVLRTIVTRPGPGARVFTAADERANTESMTFESISTAYVTYDIDSGDIETESVKR
ncbi:MAG: diphosphomevalonate decarboxylase [Polyangiaceae bacterium]